VVESSGELISVRARGGRERSNGGRQLSTKDLTRFPYVADSNLDIARRYGLIRKKEHPHGGFYYRSLWILSRGARIAYRSVPWDGNAQVEEYQRLFKLIGSQPGEWRATCGLREPEKLHAS